MRIAAVETASVRREGRSSRLLILRTDTEQVGIGELDAGGFEPASHPVRHGLADLLLGRDPYDTEALLADARSWPAPVSADIRFLAAAQTAMSDLVGQELGVPVHQLMGGRVRDHIRACAVDWIPGGADLGDLAAAAKRVVAAGFTAMRLEPFAADHARQEGDLSNAIDAVRAVREAVPDAIDLVVDVGGALTRDHAVELAERLRALEPLWLEDLFPGDSIDTAGSTGDRLTVPTAGGRRLAADRLVRLAVGGRVDHLVIDVGRVGGLLEARRLAAIAEISHVGIVPVSSCGTVALAVALQLAAAIPNLSMVEVRPGSLPVEGGAVAVDLGPGLAFRSMGVLDGALV